MSNVPERMEYVGKITKLQGETAIVRDIDEKNQYHGRLCPKKHVIAQFDRFDLSLDGTRLGFGWHPFLRSDFRKLGSKPIF